MFHGVIRFYEFPQLYERLCLLPLRKCKSIPFHKYPRIRPLSLKIICTVKVIDLHKKCLAIFSSDGFTDFLES